MLIGRTSQSCLKIRRPPSAFGDQINHTLPGQMVPWLCYTVTVGYTLVWLVVLCSPDSIWFNFQHDPNCSFGRLLPFTSRFFFRHPLRRDSSSAHLANSSIRRTTTYSFLLLPKLLWHTICRGVYTTAVHILGRIV